MSSMSSERAKTTRRRMRPRALMPSPHAQPHAQLVTTPEPPAASRRRASRANVTLLPLAAAPEAAPLSVPPVPEQTKPCILIVEDDPCAAHAIRDTLTLEGEPDWNIQVAEGGERALALAVAQPPNVVLLDVGLPDLDGAEVYHRLRAHPQMSDTRVLFLTAATSLDLYQRGVEAGVMLRKPFEMRELVGLVRTLVAS